MITPYEFLKNRDETGRLIVRMLDGTNKQYYVEFIEPRNHRISWGDVNPATKSVEGSYGDKYTGAIKAEESLITVENGFSKEDAEKIYEGASFAHSIEQKHNKWKKENGYA
jgi:hypothetical protein